MSAIKPDNEDKELSHRRVWQLAGPMILSNISVPLVGAVDTAVVGHLDAPHFIGAVAVGALIFSFLYWGFGFLRMGTTGFVAQAYGADDQREINLLLSRVMLLALAIGLLVVLFGRPVISLALALIDSTAQVEGLAREYASIRIFSAPATLCVFALTGVLIGLQNTKGALYLQLALNGSNILLDLLFVPVLQWGVAGVAWATLLSEYIALAVGCYLLRDLIKQALGQLSWVSILDAHSLKKLMVANADIFVRTLCLVFAFAYITAQGAKLGVLVLAVNAILLHLQSMMAYALDGFAFAAEALAGQAFGRRSKKYFMRAVRMTAIWGLISALVVTVIYALFGKAIIGLFTDQDAVLELAADYLPWVVILPLASVGSFLLDGIFIGTTQTAAMRNAMLVSTALFLLATLQLVPLWGNHGLLLSLCLFMLLRALSLAVYYPRILRQLN